MKIYLSSKGIRPDIDNSPIINRVLETAKPGSTLVFKDGRFPIYSTLIQKNKLNWEGAEDTTIIPSEPMTGAKISGGGHISMVNFSGNYSIWDENPEPVFNCIEIDTVMQMDNCTIRNWWGSGIYISGDVNRTPPANASHCRFDSIQLIECKEHGIYIRGGDASQINFYHIDIRDNKGTGIWDNSFLGCQFYGCMAHHNGRNYAATDANNRTGFHGCYSEGGRQPDWFAGSCEWSGINSSGMLLYENATARQGRYVSGLMFGQQDPSASNIRIDDEGLHFNRFGTTHGLKFHQVGASGFPHYRLTHLEPIYDVFGAWPGGSASYNERQVPFAAMGVKHFFIGSRLFAEGRPGDFGSFEFKPGDTILNPEGENPDRWVFTSKGWIEKNEI